jgi:hypothetical protein
VLLDSGLRALASPAEVEDAQTPESGPDRGTPSSAWTTVQVGGDVVYRGGGHVVSGAGEIVGEPVANGVVAHLKPCDSSPDPTENSLLRAVWVFSAGACGVYGYSHLAIAHTGRESPRGEIVLSSSDCAVEVRGGTGILLQVN